MLRDILNKYSANNLQELTSNFFKKMRKEKVPDDYVEALINKQIISPRMFEFKELLEKNRLADILPYEWHDEETGVYQTVRAHGFIYDCGTLAGCKANLDDQLKGLFNLGIPDGTCMQVLLLASSELDTQFNQYKSLHQSPLLQKVAEERVKFYQNGLKQTLRHGYKIPVRDFRLVISFTFDGLFNDENKDGLISLQQSISSVLKNSFINKIGL